MTSYTNKYTVFVFFDCDLTREVLWMFLWDVYNTGLLTVLMIHLVPQTPDKQT